MLEEKLNVWQEPLVGYPWNGRLWFCRSCIVVLWTRRWCWPEMAHIWVDREHSGLCLRWYRQTLRFWGPVITVPCREWFGRCACRHLSIDGTARRHIHWRRRGAPIPLVEAIMQCNRTQRAMGREGCRLIDLSQRMQHSGTSETFRPLLLWRLEVGASDGGLPARSTRALSIASYFAFSTAIAGSLE